MQSFSVMAQPTQLPEKFSTGELRYDCTYSCTGKAVASWAKLRQIYQEKKWNELIVGVDEIGLDSRYTYLLFARSAQEMGYGASAEKYFEVAMASGIATTGCSPAAQTAFCDQMIMDLGLGSQCNTLLSCMKVKMTGTKLTIAKSTVASEQTYLISTDTKQKEVIEPTQIKADVSNQVVNSGASNNSLRRVEQPLFDKSTTPQLNVQTSNAPIQILIDACKALQDLQKKSDCLEMILKMGQGANLPPNQNQVQVKQTSTELENFRLAILNIIVGITSGSQWISIDEKINTALILKENISSITHEGSDEQYKIELLKILDSCEDYKFMSNVYRDDRNRTPFYSNLSTSSRNYQIGLKYGLKPDKNLERINYDNNWYFVLKSIGNDIERNFEISNYKRKNKYLGSLSWEEKTKRITNNFMLLLESSPYKDSIKIFNSRIHNVEAEILLRCDSDKDKCNSDEQVKKKVGLDNVFSVFKDVVTIHNRFSNLSDSDSSAFVVYANKYQYPISYSTFLGSRIPKLDKANETEKLVNHILNLIKERAKSPASND